MQDVRGVDEKVGPGVVGVLGDLATELLKFIRAGRVKASERNNTSGSAALTSLISQAQKSGGLVCGLSTRKIRTPWPIQYRTTRSTSPESPAASMSKFSG